MKHVLRNPRRPDELLNYRLLRLFSLAGAPVIRLCEGRYGISRREFRLLTLVVESGPISPSGLSELAHLDRARTSRIIAALLNKKLVRRDALETDGRRFMVMATDEGRRLHRKLFPQIATINRDLMSVLDEAQADALDRILTVLTEHALALNASIARDVRADRGRHAAGASPAPHPAGA